MRVAAITAALIVLLPAVSVRAAEVEHLASCTTKIFDQIAQSQRWSGKAPQGCRSKVVVEQRPGGVLVATWGVEPVSGGWFSTSFAAIESYEELSDKKRLAAANRDIMARARRLERCLKALKTDEVPQECRSRGSRELKVGEVSGAEDYQMLWLDDEGRHCVVEIATGASSATPTPPHEIDDYEPLPPGLELKLRLN